MPEDFGIIDNSESPNCTRRAIGLKSVKWTGGFWGRRFEQLRKITLPHLRKGMGDPELGHVIQNFRIYAGLEEGEYRGSYWQDEWMHKWIEGASYVYACTGDEEIDRQMDECIELIARAQEPDGYVCCGIMMYKERFVIPRRHELYNMGHLITAACAHHRATGKTSYLDIARKAADCLYDTFVPHAEEYANFSNTKSYIMAVVELYRETKDERYIELANCFIDLHGAKRTKHIEPDPDRFTPAEIKDLAELDGTDIRQTRVPLRKERFAVGHAVNSMYLYASAADVCMEQDDPELRAALDRIWTDLVTQKIYVHGGVCPLQVGVSIRGDRVGEAHGSPHDLPNSSGYNETCAQIGNFMWNWRLLLMSGEARHADLMELSLYNSMLPCIGQDGASWFYMNPLRWYGADQDCDGHKHRHERYQPTVNSTCCPTNLFRTTASLHGYLYSLTEDGISLDHYGANTLDGPLLDGSPLRLRQETDYPWDGKVTVIIDGAPDRELTIRLRIPNWATGASVAVNGEMQLGSLTPASYCELTRRWEDGDRIELDLPMEACLIEAHPKVEACRNHVAVKRGPIVYCLESPDLPEGVRVFDVRIPRGITLTPRHEPDLLNGVTVLEGTALHVASENWSGPLYRPASGGDLEEVAMRLIPYYAWANRGPAEMTIWMPLA